MKHVYIVLVNREIYSAHTFVKSSENQFKTLAEARRYAKSRPYANPHIIKYTPEELEEIDI